VTHDYFRYYWLDLQPDSMAGGLEPTVIATGTNARAHNAPGDTGDSGLGLSGRWTINGTLPACGYTVMLHATDRTILNSAPGHGYGFYVTKAVGFAVF